MTDDNTEKKGFDECDIAFAHSLGCTCVYNMKEVELIQAEERERALREAADLTTSRYWVGADSLKEAILAMIKNQHQPT